MNKTFKVVFNKARGALMVANEVTSSVQKKGVKMIVATAVAALFAGTAFAADKAYNENEKPETGYIEVSDDTNVTVKNLSFEDYTAGSGAAIWFGTAKGSITLTNTTFTNNKVTRDASKITESNNKSAAGGAVYSYGTPFKQDGGKYEGNSALSLGVNDKNNGASGGAIMMKGNANSVLTNVEFSNNSAVAKKTDTTSGGYAYGGALMIDYSTGTATGVVNPTDLEIAVTKDLIYSGNTVSSDRTAISFDTFGYHMDSAAAGGFLFLDRGSSAKFNISEGATLQIGSTVTTDDTDSIASSIPNTGTTVNEGKHAAISKTGAGTLLIKSSLDKYFGTVAVNEGTMTVESTWNIKNAVTVAKGATLSLESFTIASATDSGNQDSTGKAIGGSLRVTGTLISTVNSVFTDTTATNGTVTLEKSTTVTKRNADISFESGSKLVLTDSGTYTSGLFNSMLEVSKVETLLLPKANLEIAKKDDGTATTIESNVTVASLDAADAALEIAGGKTLTIGADDSETGSASAKTSSVGALTINESSALKVASNSTVNVTTLVAKGEVNLSNDSTLDVQELTGANAKITVGEVNGTGATLNVAKLSLKGGSIFVDPAQLYDSSVQISDLNEGTLSTNITAGTGAFVTIGTTVDAAKAAVSKLDGFDSVAIVYIGTPITIGSADSEKGSIVVKPGASSADESHSQSVVVASNGGLVIDQSAVGSSTVFKGATSITFATGSKLGLVNSTVGTLTLTDDEVVDLKRENVVTDNPFIEVASVSKTGLTTQISATGGLGALASTGMQAMTRRADSVLAQTIADRTSVDQDYATGTALWVDVTGERYQADKLDNNGSFKSDMGYGAFGADFAITEDISAGAAIQYGKGTVRSSVSNIKNSIDSYGITAYGSMKFGDAKVVAEASYIKNENDITSSQTALNQSVDTDIYSLGIRGQHRFTAGQFQFVPSVGVRVSRLNTDAMKVGAVNIKKQEQTLVQVPIALRINGFEQNAGGWSVAPSFKIAYVPTFGDKEISVLGADQTVIDTSPVQGDFGIRAQKGNLLINANFMVGGGKDGTSSVGGKAGLKYVF